MHLTILALALHCAAPVVPAQEDDDRRLQERIDRFVGRYHEQRAFGGLVRVDRDGAPFYRGTFPLGDAPVDERTPFPIASLSKAFTAALVTALMDRGVVRPDDEVRALISELDGKPVGSATLEQLLWHTSGLPGELDDIVREVEGRSFTRAELAAAIADAPLRSKPGEVHAYSNLGYVLLALIVEEVTGDTYEVALRSLLGEPLGFEGTSVGATIGDDPRGLEVEIDGSMLEVPGLDLSFAFGSGHLVSTPGDLVAFARGLRQGRVYSEELWRRATTTAGARFGHYGYGWRVLDYETRDGGTGTLVRHGGTHDGYGCNLHQYVDDDLIVVVLSNADPCPIMELTAGVAEIALGRDAPPARPSLFQVLSALESDDRAAAKTIIETYATRDVPRRRGGPECAIGPAGAAADGETPLSWSPLHASRGEEWLDLRFPGGTVAASVELHGLEGTARLRGVGVAGPEGSHRVDPPEGIGSGPLVTIELGAARALDHVSLTFDTSACRQRMALDAVAVVTPEGERIWATGASASTSLAMRIQPTTVSEPYLDVLLFAQYVLRSVRNTRLSESLGQAIVDVHPRALEAWAMLAEVRLDAGDARGAIELCAGAPEGAPGARDLAAIRSRALRASEDGDR